MAPGARLAGRYRLEQMVGSGAMAIVWRARDDLLDRPVAIKLISDALAANPAHVARFVREARIAAAIVHPNVVRVFDLGTGGDRPYLVMEYVDGGTLAARISRGSPAPAEARRLACDLLAAIGCVHAAGVLHRDVKPANVLLGSDGRARLTDFGIAGLQDATRITQPGHLMGTIRYLAPELMHGARPSRRSDLYALGVLLREVTEGGADDPALADVIQRLTHADPQRRAGDAEAVLERLRGAPPADDRPPADDHPPADDRLPPSDRPGENAGLAAPGHSRRATARRRAPSRRPAPSRRGAPSRRLRAAAAGAVGAVAAAIAAILLSAPGGPRHDAAAAASRAVVVPAAHRALVPAAQRTPSLQKQLNQLEQSVRAAARQ